MPEVRNPFQCGFEALIKPKNSIGRRNPTPKALSYIFCFINTTVYISPKKRRRQKICTNDWNTLIIPPVLLRTLQISHFPTTPSFSRKQAFLHMVIEGLRGICVEAEDETSQMISTDNLKNAFTWKLRRVYSSHSVYSLAFNHFKAYFPSIFFIFSYSFLKMSLWRPKATK